MTRDRLRMLLAIAALVLAAFAFLAAVVGGFAAPAWVLPAAVLLICVAVVIP